MIKINKKKLFILIFLCLSFFLLLNRGKTSLAQSLASSTTITDTPPVLSTTITNTPVPPPRRTNTPTQPQRICIPEQTQCVSNSECSSGCRACTKDGTSWFCTDSSWCNWCNSPQKPTSKPGKPPTRKKTPIPPANCSTRFKGDANCDGKIDGIDYSMWLNRQCTTGCSAANLVADFNNDGKVNDDDYNIWFNNRASSSIIVPTRTPSFPQTNYNSNGSNFSN